MRSKRNSLENVNMRLKRNSLVCGKCIPDIHCLKY